MCGPRPFSSNKAETASSRLRFVILGVVEKILLHDPGGITVSVKGILSLILLPDDFLDPSVHRGTGGPAIGEQCHAVGFCGRDAAGEELCPRDFPGGL